jgi:DNA adenine methylase
MKYYSPLRYPGGKGKIASFIKKVIETNGLLDCCYIEPYAGGASVALSLVIEEYAQKVVINDIDKSIYAFWHSVLHETDELCERIYNCELSVENWGINRQIQRQKENNSLLDLGFSTFYLNRINRSGIIMAGVIGGKNQDGKWKMDARFNKNDLIKRIQLIANYQNRIELNNIDAMELIEKYKSKKNVFFYLDPPYYVKGQDLYMNFYKHDDHALIANNVLNIKNSWIISYDLHPAIENLYQGRRQFDYSMFYSASKSAKGNELIVLSDDLIIPDQIEINNSLLNKRIPSLSY